MLSEAWKYYWHILFPGSGDWESDLESEIVKRLDVPEEESSVFSRIGGQTKRPDLASILAINFLGNKVVVKFAEKELAVTPLFTTSNRSVISNWAQKNPLKGNSDLAGLSKRDREECVVFSRAVVAFCGNRIQNRMRQLLKEPVAPKFEIYCRPTNDPFATVRRLPRTGLSTFETIDITGNRLLGGLGLPLLCDVEIKLVHQVANRPGPHGSFTSQDDVLVQTMKQNIEDGKSANVHQAAQSVLADAPRRSGASDESVLRRLQDKFSKKFPDDTNRRGRMSL